jgi:ATP-binding cassette subfamily C protein CydCD
MFQLLETTPAAVGGAASVSRIRAIEVDEVEVTYPGRAQPALRATSFIARPGTVTAIVGRSGGGKTTLLEVLMGFERATSGSVRIQDDSAGLIPIDEVALVSWRARVGWVPQRPVLVGADLTAAPTVGAVVRLGAPDASDDAVWSALRDADVADELVDGLSTAVGVDGSSLSVGQLQRIALARALVRTPDVLLLDEPTAALDGASERRVADAVRRIADAGAIVIVVAHRPALVAIADQLVRVGDGGDERSQSLPITSSVFDARGEGW